MPDRFSSQVDEQLAETLEKMRADGMESRAVVSSESSYILNEIMRSRNKDDLKDRLARMVGDRAAGAYAELADTIPEGERRNAARIFAETAAVYEDLAYRVPDPAARDRARRVALDLAVNEVRTYAEAIDRNDRLVLHSEKLDERISPQERDRLMAENWRGAHRELEDMTIAASNAAGDKDMDAWAAEYRHQIASAIGEDIAQVYFRMIPGASYETAYTEIRYARLKAAWIMERSPPSQTAPLPKTGGSPATSRSRKKSSPPPSAPRSGTGGSKKRNRLLKNGGRSLRKKPLTESTGTYIPICILRKNSCFRSSQRASAKDRPESLSQSSPALNGKTACG